MLFEVLNYLQNWFLKSRHFGEFTIENGNINAEYDSGVEFSRFDIKEGQYFRIIGSSLNDGVWEYPATTLTDEIFSGAVWVLSVPSVIIEIADEIKQWQDKYGATVSSPWQSESYSRGAYSRSKQTASDASLSWMPVFASRLAPWRKL